MRFWQFVNATARLLRRVASGTWQIKAKFITLMEDFAHLITPRERMAAQAYILNLR